MSIRGFCIHKENVTMVKFFEGQKKSKGKHYGLVVSRFNDFVTKQLLEGCLDELIKCGVKKNEIEVVWVPGSLEIPLVALKLAKKKTIHAVIALGAVIRGETIHFDLVAQGVSQGVREVSLMTNKPVIFGVLTTDTVNQAYKRCDDKGRHHGRYAAGAAVEMVNILSNI